MHISSIEAKISAFLKKSTNTNLELSADSLALVAQNQVAALQKQFNGEDRGEFRLRMSNIGRPIRQLHLEKLYGFGQFTSQLKNRMCLGDMVESYLLLLITEAGLVIDARDLEVKLDVLGDTIKGTLDVVINGKVYDIKSCSKWAYDNKFTSVKDLLKEDGFGYGGQLFGYSAATEYGVGGWIVMCKETGRIRVLEFTEEEIAHYTSFYDNDRKEKVLHFREDKPMPPCTGALEETHYKKPTGRKYLSKQCEFCNHKYKCHEGLTYEQKTKATWRYYVE